MKALTPLIGLALVSGLTAQSPLSTFAAWQQAYTSAAAPGRLMFFDLTVNTQITIRSIEINCGAVVPAGTVGQIDLYQLNAPLTTYLGNEQIAGNWTLVSTGTSASEDANVPTPVCFATPVTLNPGLTAMAIVVQGFGMGWTLGTGSALPGSGNQTFSNAELTMRCGAVQGIPFVSVPINSVRFNGRLHYYNGLDAGLGCSAVPGKNRGLGTDGCYRNRGSIYQTPTPTWLPATANEAATQLNASGISFVPQGAPGSPYFVQPSAAAYSDPALASPPATTLTGFLPGNDDGEKSVPLASGFTCLAGTFTSLNVHTNGIISTGPIHAAITNSYFPTAAKMLAAPVEGWYSWHDFNITELGSGQIKFHQDATTSYFTWDGVESYPTATVNPSRIQFQFNRATGQVDILWISIALAGVGNNSVQDIHLMGYSPAGASVNMGQTDFAVPVFGIPLGTGPETLPATLTVDNRAVLGGTMTWTLSNVPAPVPPATAGLGILFLSLADQSGIGFPPPFGVDLFILGAGGCALNVDIGVAPVTGVFVNPGFMSFPLFVPLDLSLVGTPWHAQAVYFDPPSNAFGAITTNYLKHDVGTW